MIVLEFLVHEKKGEVISGSYKNSDKIIEMEIFDPWRQFLPYIEKFDILSIKANGNRIDSDGYLVIQPNYQVEYNLNLRIK